MATCPRCGIINSDHANSCDVCGAAMAQVLPPRAGRNTPPSMGRGRAVPFASAYGDVRGRKNLGVAMLLALVLGPFGMFYSTIVGAVLMLVVSLILGFRTAGVALIVTWPLGVLWAAVATQFYNRKRF